MIKESVITNIASPISNQNGFVFNETLLPIFAPIIDPISTNNAGSQIISPRDQNIVAAPIHVKVVAHKEVAIALWISHPMAFKKAGRENQHFRLE